MNSDFEVGWVARPQTKKGKTGESSASSSNDDRQTDDEAKRSGGRAPEMKARIAAVGDRPAFPTAKSETTDSGTIRIGGNAGAPVPINAMLAQIGQY